MVADPPRPDIVVVSPIAARWQYRTQIQLFNFFLPFLLRLLPSFLFVNSEKIYKVHKTNLMCSEWIK
jgi:hypothetical protein